MGTWYVGVETYRTSARYSESHSINPTTFKRMKVSVFPLLLTAVVSLALGYWAYHLAHTDSDPNAWLVGVGMVLSVILTLGCATSLKLENGRVGINLKVWSGVAFVVMAITNMCFAGFGVAMPYYVIVIAILLVIHLWVAWLLSKVTNV